VIPSISIIIPTLNRPKKLDFLIKRLSGQISDLDELIIVDDSDSIQKKIFERIIGDSGIYVHRGQVLGVSSARNYGAKIAKGDYLLFLDDDDDFTESWLSDFRNELGPDPDIVYCDMELVNPDGSKKLIKNEGLKRKVVIPGAWIIKKSIFLEIGGFDERLKFGENTELFFRLDKKRRDGIFIQKANFIYNQSLDGGSKSLENMVTSNMIVLEKHGRNLSSHVRHLYHQVIGVNQIRFRNFRQARNHLWQAYLLKPHKISTLLRFLIACLPFVAIPLYSEKVRVK